MSASTTESPEWELLLFEEKLATCSTETLFAALVSLLTSHKNHAAQLMEHLTKHFDSFAALLCASEKEWNALPLTGTQLPVMIQLLRESALRYNRAYLLVENPLEDEKHLLDYLIAQMARERVEQFRILFFDAKKRLILDEVQARGTINHTPVYPREIARRCLELHAKFVILVHNHPSGDATPSAADVMTTQQVQMALALFHIHVFDHYIIARIGQNSFRKMGLLMPVP